MMDGAEEAIMRYRNARAYERDKELERRLAQPCTREEMFACIKGLKGLREKKREWANAARKVLVNR
jgi:hypothetical protein